MASDSYADWRGRLAEANDPAFWPIEAIDAELREGRAQFWCNGKAALVTRHVRYPGGAVVLEALSEAGDGLDTLWSEIAPAVEKFGKDNGIRRLFAMGRLGWAKVAKAHGWSSEMAVITKELLP